MSQSHRTWTQWPPISIDSVPSPAPAPGLPQPAQVFDDSYRISGHYARREPVRTFYQVWNRLLITAGGKELINDIISLCGGTNISESCPGSHRRSVESVLSGPANHRGQRYGSSAEWLDSWRDWTELSAVRNDKLFLSHRI